MSLAFGFALPHWQAISGGAFSPASLFAGGTVAGAWYDPSDLNTMFTTDAGTTPVAMPGLGSAVSVGLMLDKSQGLVLGSELVDTGNTTAGWSAYGANVVSQISNGVSIQFVDDGRGAKTIFQQAGNLSSDLVAGKTYEFTFTVSINTGTATISLVNLTTPPSTITITTTPQNVIFRSARTAFAPELDFSGMDAGEIISITAISVRELPGNHAIAFNDTTSRPELRARVNLLERSEEFGNAYWSKDGVTISANTTATTDPLGGNTADKITEESTSAAHVVYTTSAISASAIQYTLSVYVKAAERTFARLDFVTVGYTAGATVILNLSTLATTIANYGATSGTTATVTTVGNGWYRLVVTLTATAASYFAQIGPAISGTPANYTGDGTSGIYIWGADLRPANIGANVPAYQRIADANTYDTAGFPLYLRFDGIDDSMYTPANLNLSGTDKVAVFAGLRIAAGTGSQNVCEFSNNAFTTNGGFSVAQGPNAASSGFGFLMNAGSGIAGQTADKSVPYSSAITETFDSAQSGLANEVKLRMDGVAQTFTSTSGTDSGSGNFGSHILNIACRGATVAPTAFLNGNIYSLIIAGSAVSAGNISATEQWVAQRTGIVIP